MAIVKQAGIDIPESLHDWFGSDELVPWILSVVDEFEDSMDFFGASPSCMTFVMPKSLLCGLVYAYSVGIYSSADIVRGIEKDAGLRYLFSGCQVVDNELIRFRRVFKQAVLGALELFLMMCVKARFRQCAAAGMYFQSALNCLDGESVRRMADERIQRAIAMDHILLDDC
ncbi:MAG: hypothetical protein LR011_00575 [Verrucomicrobia bacterium]|nr:hypothetical protein [Verrucomicrobiota bacterium]